MSKLQCLSYLNTTQINISQKKNSKKKGDFIMTTIRPEDVVTQTQ